MSGDHFKAMTIEQLEKRLPLTPPKKHQIAYLLELGISPWDIIQPEPLSVAIGRQAEGGFFDHQTPDDPKMASWLAIQASYLEFVDVVYAQPTTGEFACEYGRAWALGQDILENPGATALNQAIRVFPGVISWLRGGRQGLVIIRYEQLFDRLRDAGVERVETDDLNLKKKLEHYLQPRRFTKVSLLQVPSSTAVAS